MKLQKTLAVACATALGVWAGQASAENLDLDEMAAALALPIVTSYHSGNPLKNTGPSEIVASGDSAVTMATITNGRSENVVLKVDMINGDPGAGSTWQSTSFDCELTGRETTTFVFKYVGNNQSAVYVECSNGNDTNGDKKALFTNLNNGILFVSVADPQSGYVMSEDVIFGDAIVLDTSDGEAYSFGAISFQAGNGLNNGDKVYQFDGSEYVKFPAVLATNFLAPTDDIDAELILFTLDGGVGNLPVPRAKVGGFGFNDDEMAFDFSHEFDCMDIVPLEDVNPNFAFNPDLPGLGLGSMSGHLELITQPIASPTPDVHDAQYGDANNSRKRGVHGWLVQSTDGEFVSSGQPISAQNMDLSISSGNAAWGRPLAQSTTDLVPFLGDDDTTLDADVRN